MSRIPSHPRRGVAGRHLRGWSAVAAPATASLPTAAVALGDSFISGEGAGAYQPVADVNGVAQGFPGWSAANSNAFFCHRSANASLNQASLPGIQARFNLACSGGQPVRHRHRLGHPRQGPQRSPRSSTSCGRSRRPTTSTWSWSGSAPTTARSPSATSPRSAPTGSSPTPGPAGGSSGPTSTARSTQEPCTAADLATAGRGRRGHRRDHRRGAPAAHHPRPDRRRRPAPGGVPGLHQPAAARRRLAVLIERGRPRRTTGTSSATWAPSGTRPAARSTGPASPPATCFSAEPRHPGAAPCTPRCRPSSPAATWSTSTCSRPSTAPGSARTPASPASALATPIRVQDGPTGVFVTSLSGKDKIAIQRIANTCVTYFQTCQESWHPNAAGPRACSASAWPAAAGHRQPHRRLRARQRGDHGRLADPTRT